MSAFMQSTHDTSTARVIEMKPTPVSGNLSCRLSNKLNISCQGLTLKYLVVYSN